MVEHEDEAIAEEGSQDPPMDAVQLAQLVAAIVDKKMAPRLQQLEEKQAKTDAGMEQLPGLVQQFQASLPGLINQAVQQNLTAMMQQLPSSTAETPPPALAPSPAAPQVPSLGPPAAPEQGGAGRIPLGLSVADPAPVPPAVPAPSVAQAPGQPQLPATQPQKASDLVKQMAGGGMGGLGALVGGGGGGGGGIQQLLMQMMMKKLFGGDEPKQTNPMDALMGMAGMISQFTEAMGVIIQSIDTMRGGFISNRMQEAQVGKVEAEADALVLRALNSQKAARKVGGKKA